MKKGVLLLIFFLPFLTVHAEERESVSLVRCVDGDTAVFNVGSEEIKFRFLAIDTPETVHPTKGEEAYGKDASTFTCEALTNANTIEIEYDTASSKLDKYGRGLAWIYVDQVLLQKTLIEQGLAEVAYIYGKYQYVEELCDVQATAIADGVGIWADGTREEGYCKTKSNSTATTTTEKTQTEEEETSSDDRDVSDEEWIEDTLQLIKKYPMYAPVILLVAGVYFLKKKK